MFKCTECGSEYEVKPDYCDCGNDTFVEEEANDRVNEKVKAEVKPEVTPKSEQTSDKLHTNHLPPQVDPISLTIFIICIFLSFIVVFFLFNPKETIEKVVEKQNLNQNIPSIEKLWKDTAPTPVQTETKAPTPTLPKGDGGKQAIQTIKQPKPVQKQTVTTKPKTTQTTKQTTTKSAPTLTLPQGEGSSAAKKEDEARKAAEEAAKKYEEVKKAAEDLQNSMFAKQELAQYKTQLRNIIGKRIDFTRVVGDGDCAISFKIDTTGRLIKGAFAKQSSNITLNDAVYKAFMNSRSYNPPPSGYKNETLTLSVKFYNGNFSISLN